MHSPPRIPPHHRPRGLEILYEDRHLFVINKEAGLLTTAPRHVKARTAESVLNDFFRKGSRISRRSVFLVHRLDRETSGVMLFAKSFETQQRLKNDWARTEKLYLAALCGHLAEPCGILTSYLAEDEDLYMVPVGCGDGGKLARTAYVLIGETRALSLVKIRLLSGRKNQVRVQFAERGCPVAGDRKYGHGGPPASRLCLHAKSIALAHPHDGRPLFFDTPIPPVFGQIAPGFGEADWNGAPTPPGRRSP